MKLSNFRRETNDKLARIAATVVWEDSDRPEQEIHFATHPEFASALSNRPDAFLVACAVAALEHGEKRIAVDGEVCPLLREGILTNLGWISHWRQFSHAIPEIEAAVRGNSEKPRTTRTAAFMSGGVDSLFTLRWNRLNVPESHAFSIKDAVIVKGIEPPPSPLLERALQAVAGDTGVTLIPVETNVRELDADGVFWGKTFHGAALASVAHALGGRIAQILLASTDHIPRIVPWGSHPLLDHNWSSQNLRVIHDGERFSRFDKVRVVSGWSAGLSNMRVCTQSPKDSLNCGRCEKCLRTELALAALGKLGDCPAFPLDDVDSEQVSALQILDEHPLSYYAELLPALEARGRGDLAGAIEHLIASYRPWSEWRETAIQEIESHVSPGAIFVLMDEDEWGTGEFIGTRRRIPFTEKNGVYGGAPEDDETAIRELERHRAAGAEFLIVGWPAFWWLDYYSGLHEYLASEYPCILSNSRLMVYDLKGEPEEANEASDRENALITDTGMLS